MMAPDQPALTCYLAHLQENLSCERVEIASDNAVVPSDPCIWKSRKSRGSSRKFHAGAGGIQRVKQRWNHSLTALVAKPQDRWEAMPVSPVKMTNNRKSKKAPSSLKDSLIPPISSRGSSVRKGVGNDSSASYNPHQLDFRKQSIQSNSSVAGSTHVMDESSFAMRAPARRRSLDGATASILECALSELKLQPQQINSATPNSIS
uniref:Uncharacterized protein n=1 Tax=Entomoneis paludosa TaxID=265537 RepID=A0A7S2Y9W8_9STRA|mmetsp:Transcript_24167/g.50245  ORF Transcript_24167/g.50245 Transcript_24167/m.50245 type:complete len:205 (+) Transcript_24167:393-1007(+)